MESVCRTCLKILDKNTPCSRLCDDDLSRKLQRCLPELKIDLVTNPIFCPNCIEALSVSYEFKILCIETEALLHEYLQSERNAGMDRQLDIYDLLRICMKNVHKEHNYFQPAAQLESIVISNIERNDTEVNTLEMIVDSSASEDTSAVIDDSEIALEDRLKRMSEDTSAAIDDSETTLEDRLKQMFKGFISANENKFKSLVEDFEGGLEKLLELQTDRAVSRQERTDDENYFERLELRPISKCTENKTAARDYSSKLRSKSSVTAIKSISDKSEGSEKEAKKATPSSPKTKQKAQDSGGKSLADCASDITAAVKRKLVTVEVLHDENKMNTMERKRDSVNGKTKEQCTPKTKARECGSNRTEQHSINRTKKCTTNDKQKKRWGSCGEKANERRKKRANRLTNVSRKPSRGTTNIKSENKIETNTDKNRSPNNRPLQPENPPDADATIEEERTVDIYDEKSQCYRCPKCDLSCALLSKLDHHFKSHILKDKMRTCPICEKSFALEQYMQRHIDRHTHVGQTYNCKTCKRSLSSLTALKRHTIIHTGEKPFKCNVCHKKFTQKIQLKVHMRTHTGSRPFECSVCNLKFTQKVHLDGHLRIHRNEKPYLCKLCPKQFRKKVALQYHIACHTRKPFTCKMCNYMCKDVHQFRRHLYRHVRKVCRYHDYNMISLAEDGTYKFPPGFEDDVKETYSGVTMNRDLEVTLDKMKRWMPSFATYVCEFCPKEFLTIANRDKHMKVHEGRWD